MDVTQIILKVKLYKTAWSLTENFSLVSHLVNEKQGFMKDISKNSWFWGASSSYSKGLREGVQPS